jgi:mannose-6-phosphate isomerase-like protein (cupin superfamily)
MMNIRRFVLAGLLVMAVGAGWLSKTLAEDTSSYTFVTVFDHKKVDASFDKAVASGGSMVLFRRATPEGSYRVNTQSRESVRSACPTEGCFHKGFTAVVYVVSGSATLVIGGAKVTANNAAPDKFGGEPILPGESHRISKGDVVVVPPARIHWYKDVESPFRYLEVQTP